MLAGDESGGGEAPAREVAGGLMGVLGRVERCLEGLVGDAGAARLLSDVRAARADLEGMAEVALEGRRVRAVRAERSPDPVSYAEGWAAASLALRHRADVARVEAGEELELGQAPPLTPQDGWTAFAGREAMRRR